MKKRKNYLIGLLLAVGLALLALPIVSILADTPTDLTGQTDYLVVHNTTDSYTDTGGPSSLVVKTSTGTVIMPTNNTYSDVPAGATIDLVYAFHLEDGVGEGELYSYSDSNYFYITLPGGISFHQPVGQEANIYATDTSTSTTWLLGTWSFSSSNTIKVQLAPGVADHSEMWGKITITGTFDKLSADDSITTTMTLGSQTITFEREVPPPPAIALAKSGVYDAATNTITWTVTAKPPNNTTDIGGYSLVDTYSSNQTYKAGSFTVGGSGIADSSLNLTTANKVIYTFPDETYGTQTITYKTTPLTFSAESGVNGSGAADYTNFTNTVTVNWGSTAVTDPVTATVKTDWISKSVGAATTTAGVTYNKWTIVVTVPNSGTITGTSIADVIPAGIELVENDTTHPIQIKINSGTATTVSSGTTAGTYTYAYTNTSTASPLSYQFADSLTGTATLTYYTKVTNRQNSLNNNGTVSFTNSAKLNWTENPDANNSPKDVATATIVGSGGLIAKSGGSSSVYTYPGYIAWTITVNNSAISMPGAAIKDTVPTGQKLLIDATHAFTVKNSAGTTVFTADSATATTEFTSVDNFVKDFSYTFGDITSKYTVTYYTEIIDVNTTANNDTSGLDTLYVNNNTVNFGNKVVLSRTGETDTTVNVNKTYQSQMIAKTIATAYDYTTHTVQWQIVVNRNQLPLTNALVTDTLPAGMKLLIDESHPFNVVQNGVATPVATAPTTGANGDTAFTYNFGSISDQYAITFYTKLTDATLIAQWTGTKDFTNAAVLKADQLKSDLTATATSKISNPIVTKTAAYTAGSDHIDWTAVINPAQVVLNDASVSDVLDPGLQLDASSVKLYKVAVSADGTVASTGTEVTSGFTVTLPTTGNNNTLKVALPNGTDTYLLQFTTYILLDDINFTNKITLTGDATSPVGTASATNIKIDNLWSSGGSGSQVLTVHKEDGDGNPVAGATYRLLNFNKDPIKKSGNYVEATTDENGDAVFKNLPKWLFYAVEVDAPDGYLLNTDYVGGERLDSNLTFDTEDETALGDLSFDKVATDDAILSGGTFTLTGTDYENQVVTQTASAVDGVVTFTDLPLGDYTVVETVAPTGYVESTEGITATVGYNNDETATVTTITSENNSIVNRPLPTGTITINKTDGTDALPGAEFTLYDDDEAVVDVATSAENGEVTFDDVAAGTYTIMETKSPIGYLISDTELTATITYNEDKTECLVDISPDSTIVDTPIAPTTIKLTKTNGENPLKGATFGLYDSKGALLQSAVSDIDGLVQFTKVGIGDYTIHETQAPEDYLLNETVINVTVAYNEANTAMVVTQSESTVVDKINPATQIATIVLTKTDDAGTALKGAVFELYNESGTAVAQATSDADGKVTFANVLIGKYTIKEITAPAGYTLSSQTAQVELTKADVDTVVKATPYTFTDNRIGATIQIKKVDSSTNALLSGAVFTMVDAKGAIVATATSDKNGLATFSNVMPGTYTIAETKAPTGYTASTEKLTVTTALDKTYTFTVQNTAQKTIPQSGIFWDGKMLLLAGIFLIVMGSLIGLMSRKRRSDKTV